MRVCDTFGVGPVEYAWILLRVTPWLVVLLAVAAVTLLGWSLNQIISAPLELTKAWIEMRGRNRLLDEMAHA